MIWLVMTLFDLDLVHPYREAPDAYIPSGHAHRLLKLQPGPILGFWDPDGSAQLPNRR